MERLLDRGVGRGEIRRERKGEADGKAPRIAILAFGTLLYPALEVGEALDATVVNMRWVKPVDADLIESLARTHDAFVTIEEHAVMGGAGSACLEAMMARGVVKPVLQLGLPDVFIDQGDPAQLLRLQGLDAAGIERSVRERFADLIAGEGAPRLVASR